MRIRLPHVLVAAAALAGCGGSQSATQPAGGIPPVRTVSPSRQGADEARGPVLQAAPSTLTFGAVTAPPQTFVVTSPEPERVSAAVSAGPGVCSVSPARAKLKESDGTDGVKSAVFTVTPQTAGSCTVTVTDEDKNTVAVTVTIIGGIRIFVPNGSVGVFDLTGSLLQTIVTNGEAIAAATDNTGNTYVLNSNDTVSKFALNGTLTQTITLQQTPWAFHLLPMRSPLTRPGECTSPVGSVWRCTTRREPPFARRPGMQTCKT